MIKIQIKTISQISISNWNIHGFKDKKQGNLFFQILALTLFGNQMTYAIFIIYQKMKNITIYCLSICNLHQG